MMECYLELLLAQPSQVVGPVAVRTLSREGAGRIDAGKIVIFAAGAICMSP